MKTRAPSFLLLQARAEGDDMARHELDCFVETLQVAPETIKTHNLLHGIPTDRQWQEVDAILVGGSGDYTLVNPLPIFKEFIDFVDRVILSGQRAAFASCFGFQALVVAGGGSIIHNSLMAEVGTYDLTLTEYGRQDPLFGSLPSPFKAQLGHKDSAIQLPAGMKPLASTEKVELAALRVEGLPLVATQFHPELSKKTNTERYLRYWLEEGEGSLEDDPVMQSMAESPEASALLPRWMKNELIPWMDSKA